jgi:hypothetical protein
MARATEYTSFFQTYRQDPDHHETEATILESYLSHTLTPQEAAQQITAPPTPPFAKPRRPLRQTIHAALLLRRRLSQRASRNRRVMENHPSFPQTNTAIGC